MKKRVSFFLLICITLIFLVGSYRPCALEMGDPSKTVTQKSSKTQGHVTRVLLLGKDRAAGLADAMILVSINEDTHRVGILQIPRDTYVEYTKKDYKKINAMPRVLGDRETKLFLSRSIGIELDYFISLDLDVLDRLVDAVGGVDVEIPQDMHYEDPSQGLVIDLKKGRSHLNGKEAEQFVRFRSGYANADLGRIDAQKSFIRAFAKKCNSLSAGECTRIVGALLTRLCTDVDLPAAIRLCRLLRECDADLIGIETLSGSAVQGLSGAWYYSVCRDAALVQCNRILVPSVPLNQQTFDPHGVFDRKDHPEFHNIYIAPATNEEGQ